MRKALADGISFSFSWFDVHFDVAARIRDQLFAIQYTAQLPPGAPAAEGKVAFGPFTLDLAARTLTSNDTTIHLTTGEFALVKVFVEHPRQPLGREKLTLLARGRDHDVFDRAIDVQA